MKRLCLLAALMLFSSPVDAGNGISFSIGGHRIHIDSARCRSLSCVSVSGVTRRNDGGDNGRTIKAPPVTTGAIPVGPPASNSPATNSPLAASPRTPPQLIVDRPAPPALAPVAAPATPAPPPAPRVVVTPPAVVVAPPPPPPPAVVPAGPVRPAPKVVRVSREPDDEPADGPIGDWQTETNTLVRIRLCGQALCGYVLDRTSRDLGETVLINMKPKQGAQWSGSVYSHDSGSTSYGTIEPTGVDGLRVETCAFGHFYCTRTGWTRVSRVPQRMTTQRQSEPDPRS